MSEVDMDHLRNWIGRSELRQEVLAAEKAVSLAATLDRSTMPKIGDPVPPLWHWAYFLPLARRSELGPDGHPKLGRFMPPIPLPRRMWVGGRLRFLNPIRLGETASRRTEITNVASKTGKNGPLVFVTLQHEIRMSGLVCISEEQDLVYRAAEKPSDFSKQAIAATETAAEAKPADWREGFVPDRVLLFRYSAVTFNAHRIHYDERFAIDEENYPGLVVHGPLTATLLADGLAKRTGRELKEFSFRAARPLFCDHEMQLCGKQLGANAYEVWSETPGGQPSMTASAIVA